MIIRGNTVGHPLPDPRRGLEMAGAIHMNGYSLTGLKAPQADSDAATKRYAEDFAKTYADSLHRILTVALPASGWSAAAPYTQQVAAQGILASDTPHYGVVYSADEKTALAERESFCLVDDLQTGDAVLTFTCFEDRPEADLTIQLEVNR